MSGLLFFSPSVSSRDKIRFTALSSSYTDTSDQLTELSQYLSPLKVQRVGLKCKKCNFIFMKVVVISVESLETNHCCILLPKNGSGKSDSDLPDKNVHHDSKL